MYINKDQLQKSLRIDEFMLDFIVEKKYSENFLNFVD